MATAATSTASASASSASTASTATTATTTATTATVYTTPTASAAASAASAASRWFLGSGIARIRNLLVILTQGHRSLGQRTLGRSRRRRRFVALVLHLRRSLRHRLGGCLRRYLGRRPVLLVSHLACPRRCEILAAPSQHDGATGQPSATRPGDRKNKPRKIQRTLQPDRSTRKCKAIHGANTVTHKGPDRTHPVPSSAPRQDQNSSDPGQEPEPVPGVEGSRIGN